MSLLAFLSAILPWIALLGFWGLVAVLLVRGVSSRGDGRRGEIDELRARVMRLQEQVDAMGEETARMREKQDFLTRLLQDRGGGDGGR